MPLTDKIRRMGNLAKIKYAKQKYIGQKFGRLKIIDYIAGTKNIGAKVKCRCECKKIKIIKLGDIRQGKIVSCGCWNAEKQSGYKHGKIYSPEWKTWIGMRKRCLNLNDSKFEYYGGRGIKICKRWIDKNKGFLNFLSDMGEKPSALYSIDRINNSGNYTPKNCRWATKREQALNRRKKSKLK